MADAQPAVATLATCDKHGPYEAKPFFPNSRKLAGCPTCERERQAAEEREAKEAMAAGRLARRLAKSGLQPRMLAASFENFVCDSDEQRRVLAACRNFAETFDEASGGGLWLIGAPGTGKTHLGSSMVQHVIRAKHEMAGLFSARQIINMQRASWGGVKGGHRTHRASDPWDMPEDDAFADLRTTSEVVDFMAELPLLVLDEVGVGFQSNAEQVQLYDVIDMRYQHCRPTVVISNLPPAELKTVLGDRSYDRLREGAKVLACNWPSARGVNRAPCPAGEE
ncbi:ATP-binding protein [Acidovorax sp. SUPP2522]|uniref:ATP-binding protein n=1 Tax=unclassified Acidovorax TaxID=2684926 RepID=UPI00234A975A|nr:MULTISPECIES: ATP-binding protein [unclassified Acidovorax]WCM96247.1 ATP-binding protein [Acidovorax sp. GBBC 1281]GKT19789.1 ATP-binding protein [Acidovorax sp. SUPP2522]